MGPIPPTGWDHAGPPTHSPMGKIKKTTINKDKASIKSDNLGQRTKDSIGPPDSSQHLAMRGKAYLPSKNPCFFSLPTQFSLPINSLMIKYNQHD